jgi:hypothetical protein
MKENTHLIITILFLFYCIAFAIKGKKRNHSQKSLLGEKRYFLKLTITEPWKTKYRWGGIIQLVLFALIIGLQF